LPPSLLNIGFDIIFLTEIKGQFTQEEGKNSYAKGVYKKGIVFNLTV
jgi:hypothetical protein